MNDPLGVHVGMGGEDDELAQIRAKRMAQLQSKGAAGGGRFAGMPGGMQGMSGMGGAQSAEQQREQAEKQQAADEQRAQILKAILSPQARERLANIAMVKKDKARKIEDMLITQAHRGAFQGQVDEEQLIAMLESINEATQSKSKVTIQRRRMDDDW